MYNNDVSLFVENKRVTLFPDENITLKQAIQSLKDLTKAFTDFTKSFSIPADDNNNNIFKHYYDAQVVNGFDARVKVNARIELGGIVYKMGKIQLNGATLKNNTPTKYKIEFFGDTVTIKDLIGDDKLTDLDLSEYDHSYTPVTIRTGLDTGLGSNQEIKYPLLSYKRRFLWEDVQQDDDQNINIKYDAAFTSGVDWQELKPVIKVNAILNKIEDTYGLNFTNDFFSRPEWDNLYMSLGNGKNDYIPYTTELVNTINVNAYQRPNTRDMMKVALRAIVSVNSGTSEYRVVFALNGTNVYVSDWVTGDNTLRYISDLVVFGNYQCDCFIESKGQIDIDVNFSYVSVLFNAVGFIVQYDETDNDVNLITPVSQVSINALLPDMKITDWFAAMVKTSNLVIEPLQNGNIYVNDLPSWYNSGKIIDITKYVDIETLEVSRGKLYKEVNFGYQDQKSLLAEEYESQFGQQFGGFENDLIGISSDDELVVKLPFENPQFERLTGSANQYGFIVDKELEPYNNKPFLLYSPLINTPDKVGFSGDTYVPLSFINIPTHAMYLDSGFSAQYNAEYNEYNGALLPDNWYSRYYSDYFNDLFSPQRRQFTINCNLPITIATELRLNDRLIIKGDRYIIDNIDTNLLTGVSKLVLLNDIFTDLEVGDISKLSVLSGSYQDKGAVYYTGSNYGYVTTDSDWINLQSDFISSGNNIEFTLDINKTGNTRVGTIYVQDGLSNPITLIQQDLTGFISWDSNIVTFDNNNITF